ncbi:MAG: peroxidase-related enzyme [Gemmatimonadota bacterium]
MSWIRQIHETDAAGKVARVYNKIQEKRGRLSNIMRVQSLAPEAMDAHMDLYLAIMFGKGGLSRAERELMAVVVSVENGCEYCTLHHAAALEAWWKDPERVAGLREDPDHADLNPREAALAEYARILTRHPQNMAAQHLEPLRAHGLTDEEILQANMVVSYFNFVNRIAQGLGVSAPPDEVGGYKY